MIRCNIDDLALIIIIIVSNTSNISGTGNNTLCKEWRFADSEVQPSIELPTLFILDGLNLVLVSEGLSSVNGASCNCENWSSMAEQKSQIWQDRIRVCG